MSTIGNKRDSGYVTGSDLDPNIVLPSGSELGFTPTGGITADTVTGAVVELDHDKVNVSGNQTIADVKTFSSSPIVPTATTSGQAVNFSQVLGVGQTWQDVTASRALGVTYTNSTGKPIMVSVEIGSTTDVTCAIKVNNIYVAYQIIRSPYSNNNNTYAIVPAGATYLAEGYGAGLYHQWRELR